MRPCNILLIAIIYLQFFLFTNSYLWRHCILQIFTSFSLLPMQSMISWYGQQPGQVSGDPFFIYFFQDNDIERDGVNLSLEVGVISIADLQELIYFPFLQHEVGWVEDGRAWCANKSKLQNYSAFRSFSYDYSSIRFSRNFWLQATWLDLGSVSWGINKTIFELSLLTAVSASIKE